MMKDFGLVAVTGFGLIVAVFVAAGLVHKEVEKRTVFVLFSKPVSRAAFIAGKFVGLCGTMAVVLAGMGLFLFVLVWLVDGDPVGMVLVAVVMIYVQLLAVMAVTIFFSTLGSAILASVLGICVFVAGQLSHNVLALTRLGKNARHRGAVVGRLRHHPELLGAWTSRPAWWASRRSPGVRSGCGPRTSSPTWWSCWRWRRWSSGARSSERVRRLLAVAVVVLCAGVVVAYQATRPAQAPADARVFVPSPQFFLDFSPSFRTSLADVLLPVHGPVLRRAHQGRRQARLAARRWSTWSRR